MFGEWMALHCTALQPLFKRLVEGTLAHRPHVQLALVPLRHSERVGRNVVAGMVLPGLAVVSRGPNVADVLVLRIVTWGAARARHCQRLAGPRVEHAVPVAGNRTRALQRLPGFAAVDGFVRYAPTPSQRKAKSRVLPHQVSNGEAW